MRTGTGRSVPRDAAEVQAQDILHENHACLRTGCERQGIEACCNAHREMLPAHVITTPGTGLCANREPHVVYADLTHGNRS